MQSLNITGDYAALESYFIKKIIDIVTKKGLNPVVWEEVFDNGVKLGNNTIVHVWKDGYAYTLNEVSFFENKDNSYFLRDLIQS